LLRVLKAASGMTPRWRLGLVMARLWPAADYIL